MNTSLSNDALAFLLKHDSDDFTRWDAGQQLIERLILQCYKENVNKDSKDKISQNIEVLLQLWLDSMRALLQDESVHPALKAELLSLPPLSYLIELQEAVDVDALYAALQYVKHALVGACHPLLLQAYQSNVIKESYAYTPEQTAKRYLKNTALRYLGPVSKEGLQLCKHQWQHAYNMTDSFAAVSAISDIDCPERTAILDAFYERWQHDTNVLDKWFRVQATSEIPNALMNVKNLCQHPAFSIKNPNKVYSLINAFVLTNVAFHAASGEGYQFLTDKVLELNVLNPQVAARLLKVFGNWKKLDKGRQEKIRAQLLRIKNAAGISKDVFEVADKSLG